jgi:hypothetical protein
MTADEFAQKLKEFEIRVIARTNNADEMAISHNEHAQYLNALLQGEHRELQRRVRWLERFFKNGHSFAVLDMQYNQTCVACGRVRGEQHRYDCEYFEADGTPKPTPEDFK